MANDKEELRGEERKIVSTRLYRSEFANLMKICNKEDKSVNQKLREIIKKEIKENFNGGVGLNQKKEKSKKMKVMFDTNIFDTILDEQIDLVSLPNENEYYATHIQNDEIEAISNPKKEERKKKLLEIFEELNKENIPTESFVLDLSRLNNAKLGEGDLLEKLRQDNLKHTEDALIGETAIKNNITLITKDNRLKNKVLELGGKAKTWDEFINRKKENE